VREAVPPSSNLMRFLSTSPPPFFCCYLLAGPATGTTRARSSLPSLHITYFRRSGAPSFSTEPTFVFPPGVLLTARSSSRRHMRVNCVSTDAVTLRAPVHPAYFVEHNGPRVDFFGLNFQSPLGRLGRNVSFRALQPLLPI